MLPQITTKCETRAIHSKNSKDEKINAIDAKSFHLITKAIKLVLNQTHTAPEALAILNDEWGYRTKKLKEWVANHSPQALGTKFLQTLNTTMEKLAEVKVYSTFLMKYHDHLRLEITKKVQVILGRKSNRRNDKKKWAYTGLGLVCGECSGTVVMDEKWQIICPVCKLKFHKAKDRTACPGCNTPIATMKEPKILHYTWLYGNHKPLPNGGKCSQRSLAVQDFEGQVDRLLQKITIPENLSKWAIKWIQNEHAQEVTDRTNIKDNLQALDTSVQKKIDNLLDTLLAGLISDEEYQRKKDSLLQEQQNVRRKLQETDTRADTGWSYQKRLLYLLLMFDTGLLMVTINRNERYL